MSLIVISVPNDSLTTGKVTVKDMGRLFSAYPAQLLYFELLWRGYLRRGEELQPLICCCGVLVPWIL